MPSWIIFHITLQSWEFLLKLQFLLKLLLNQISCCAPRFPLILTAKFHFFNVKGSEPKILERSESEILGTRSRKFWKVGFGYFASDSATLVESVEMWRRKLNWSFCSLKLVSIKMEIVAGPHTHNFKLTNFMSLVLLRTSYTSLITFFNPALRQKSSLPQTTNELNVLCCWVQRNLTVPLLLIASNITKYILSCTPINEAKILAQYH